MSKKLYSLLLLLLAGIIALYFYHTYRVAPDVNLNELPLSDENGKDYNFHNLKGKKMIVSFYASWCGNCIQELKEINKIKQTELNDVEIICITDEPLEKLIDFKNEHAYPFTFLKLNKAFPDIGIHSIPVTYIVNQKLEIVKEEVGYIEWGDPSTINHIKGLY